VQQDASSNKKYFRHSACFVINNAIQNKKQQFLRNPRSLKDKKKPSAAGESYC